MLVTFKCKSFHDIVMFGDVAVNLLKGMGESGRVPGALRPKDIATVQKILQEALTGDLGDTPTNASHKNHDEAEDESQQEEIINLRQRALPLLDMLAAAAEEECDVMWE